ncbi:MAG TPA: hypothetical protein VNE62_06620 [Actinomycetota bacterium]|nr:hypothetical protein [Actinomycetota bacterium]
MAEQDDFELLRKAERALSEIDRTQGLIDRHADVLAALRIRIEGAPRKSLDDLIAATGEIEGRRGKELDRRLRDGAPEPGRPDLSDLLTGDEGPRADVGDLLAKEQKSKKTLDDLLG